MVNIEWAKNNCKINLERLSDIRLQAEWLEDEIDRNITVNCLQGKNQCFVNPRILLEKHFDKYYYEATDEVLNKYKTNGFDIERKDAYDYGNLFVIRW